MARETRSIVIWDPLVRIFHWSLAGCFIFAYLVEGEMLTLHVAAGYTVAGLVFFRLLWGVIGSEHARFSDFVRRPAAVISYLKDILAFRAKRNLGHNPAGGAMVLALLACLAATALSGILLLGATEMSGPLAHLMTGASIQTGDIIEETHEVFANLTLLLVLLHVAGVVIAGLQHKENLILGMITGRKDDRVEPHTNSH